MSSENSLVDFGQRQVVPISEAVKGPLRFRRRDWERSQQVREILDAIMVPQTPRPEQIDQHTESVVLEGAAVMITIRSGGAHARRSFNCNFASDKIVSKDLEIAPDDPVQPFASVEPSIRQEAAQALQTLQNRPYKPKARMSIAAPRRSPSVGFPWVATVMVVIALGVAIAAAWGRL
jgi:hypothetical protein